MSREAQNKARTVEEPTCTVCGSQGGHAPGCWVGQTLTEAPAEEPKDTEDKDEE